MGRWFGRWMGRKARPVVCGAIDNEVTCDRPPGHPGFHDGPIPSVAPDARWAWGDTRKRYRYDEEGDDA